MCDRDKFGPLEREPRWWEVSFVAFYGLSSLLFIKKKKKSEGNPLKMKISLQEDCPSFHQEKEHCSHEQGANDCSVDSVALLGLGLL